VSFDVAEPKQVPGALAAMFACPLRTERSVLQQLAAHIGSKDILLVLDHFEHLLAAKEDLAQLLQRCPGLVVIVTSRQRLGLMGEWVFPLGGLNAPPAGMETAIDAYSAACLFVQAARQARPDFELDEDAHVAVAEICRLVGGLPLALVLLATWVRVLPCVELAAELRRGSDVIRRAGQRPGEERVSIRSVLEQSWQSLAPGARTALAALSVFHGGCDREAAQVVAGADLDTVSHLVDHSLLQVSAAGRITSHELVQQFAAEQLATAGQGEQLAHRHFAYFLVLAERNAAQLSELSSLAPFLWFGQEQANLEAAAAWGAINPERVSQDEVQRLRAAVRRAGHRDGAHRGEFFQL
jgi:predicted ATPase